MVPMDPTKLSRYPFEYFQQLYLQFNKAENEKIFNNVISGFDPRTFAIPLCRQVVQGQ